MLIVKKKYFTLNDTNRILEAAPGAARHTPLAARRSPLAARLTTCRVLRAAQPRHGGTESLLQLSALTS